MPTTWSIQLVSIASINTGIAPVPDPERVARFAECRLYERIPVALVERNGKFYASGLSAFASKHGNRNCRRK